MPPITFQDLPLNIYMVIFGTGIFVFVLSLIFCCYFIRSPPLQEEGLCLALAASPQGSRWEPTPLSHRRQTHRVRWLVWPKQALVGRQKPTNTHGERKVAAALSRAVEHRVACRATPLACLL
ncbi:UNVERIFIED_CONTAM: hypothetical protein K2H54_027927 [Gekko kuhli]